VQSPSSGLACRPATGEFDTDGTLTVTTFKKGDGLLPGTYKIAVSCWDTAPQMGSPVAAKSYITVRYRSAATSGLEVTVSPGQRRVEVNLDIPKK
jgi:hypothetical protein